jgi:hypothetical protein
VPASRCARMPTPSAPTHPLHLVPPVVCQVWSGES